MGVGGRFSILHPVLGSLSKVPGHKGFFLIIFHSYLGHLQIFVARFSILFVVEGQKC